MTGLVSWVRGFLRINWFCESIIVDYILFILVSMFCELAGIPASGLITSMARHFGSSKFICKIWTAELKPVANPEGDRGSRPPRVKRKYGLLPFLEPELKLFLRGDMVWNL